MASGYTLVPTAPKAVGDVKPRVDKIYQARLYVRGGEEDLDISTPLPELFPLDLVTSWDTPFNQPLSEMGGTVGQFAESALTSVGGMTTISKWQSGAVWTQGSTISMQIPFVLQAYSDPVAEVLTPMKKLMKLVAPDESKGFLRAPGPHGLNTDTGTIGGEYIVVEIGNFLRLEPVIIEAVSEEFKTQFDAEGSPIAVTINVSIKTFWTTTRQDLDKYFLRG